jgi:hypothetical protein
MSVVSCLECKKEFYVKPSHIKIGWGKFCSITCRNNGQLRGKIISCFICNKKVYKANADIKKSKSGNFFCSKRCQTIWRNSIVFVGEKHANWISGESAYRRILEAVRPEKICLMCKISDERVIIVHHIDKNRRNNNVSNLTWLCNNCHYLVHHYTKEKEKLNKLLID